MKPIQVLFIGNNDEDFLLINECLQASELIIRMERVSTLEQGFEIFPQEEIDVILLDLGLPGYNGLEAFDQLYSDVPHIPIIIITGYDDQERASMAIGRGAQDYLIKGQLSCALITRSLRYSIERKRSAEALRLSELSLRRTNRLLVRTVNELKEANRLILENQKSVIEEERLKAILEMSNATAHELNQPLTALLGNIELMWLRKNDPLKLIQHLKIIEKSGFRIADIVKKIYTLRYDEKKPYVGDMFMINIHQKINVLSVEDSDYDYELLYFLLKDDDWIKLLRVKSIQEAMQLLEKNTIDLIILDHMLPDGNGIDFFKLLKKKELDIPVVVNTAYGDEVIASQLIKEGAYDYIDKKFLSKKTLYRCINNTMEKHRLKMEIKYAREKMATMATRDELTGLYNRRYFLEIVDREIARAKRDNSRLTFCMISLDEFRGITDSYGLLAGDMVLSEIGKLLLKSIRLSDLLCRFSHEKFAVILPSTGLDCAQTVCKRFKSLIGQQEFEYNSSRFSVSVSIGTAVFDQDEDRTSQHLIQKADLALSPANHSQLN